MTVPYTFKTQAIDEFDNINTMIVGAIDQQGKRKGKNFTLRIQNPSQHPIAWALVYVPEAQQPSKLSFGVGATNTSFYEPNQNVIMSGIASKDTTQQTFRSRLARYLNSGDCIVLVCRQCYAANQQEGPVPITVLCSYVIGF